MKLQTTRRNFLKTSAFVVALPTIIPASALGLNGHVAPSNRITVGAIGLGGRGRRVLRAFLNNPDVQVVSVCDVQRGNLLTAKTLVDEAYKNQDCHTTADLRETLARTDVDSVMIATGDRWHAVASILSAKAGKDVFSEKPCAITMTECREIDDAMRLYGRVFQAGTQRRNIPCFLAAIGLARSGRLGRIHTVHASINVLEEKFAWLPAEPQPPVSEVDWDLWLGPAPWRPYNSAYTRGRWRGHHDFDAGGRLLDWGVHTVDLCQMALGMDGTTPVEFDPHGQTIHARYANGVKLVLRLGGFKGEGDWLGLGTCPVRFEGDEGWVEAGDVGRAITSSPSLLDGQVIEPMAGTAPETHVREFLDCVKSRGRPAANSSAARSTHVACHAAAIATRLGRKLTFDPITESFPDNEEANRLRSRARRAPWHA